MFTGIIQRTAVVRSIVASDAGRRVVIDPSGWDHEPAPGDSVACSGCCLTLVSAGPGGWVFDVIPETLDRTTLGTWGAGSRVNLERSLRVGDGLDGHQVQGHVDGVGRVVHVDESAGWRVRVGVPGPMRRWMIPKGSVAIDGVSLTIAALADDGSWIECALIPETLERTTLGGLAAGDGVNLEGDVLVKTVVATVERLGAVH